MVETYLGLNGRQVRGNGAAQKERSSSKGSSGELHYGEQLCVKRESEFNVAGSLSLQMESTAVPRYQLSTGELRYKGERGRKSRSIQRVTDG